MVKLTLVFLNSTGLFGVFRNVPTLTLGVIDLPYTDGQGTSTGDVAKILEAKYGVMQVFFDFYKDRIIAKLEEITAKQIENLFVGISPQPDPFAEVSSFIKDSFSKFLLQREIERLGIEGVPTKAALSGISHRFKKPYAKRPSRPSFIDTGLYESVFQAEIKT